MKKEIAAILQRNKRVEADKAWETSKTRRSIIVLLTYCIVVLFLFSIGAPKPWLSALVPTIGFFLSTISIPFIKKWWINNIYKKY